MEHVLETKLSLYYFIIRYWGITVLLMYKKKISVLTIRTRMRQTLIGGIEISGNFSID